MFTSIKHYLSVGYYFAKLSLQRQLEYPLFLVSWLLMVPLQWFAGIMMLKLIVYKFHALQGWDFPQLAFLYGLSLLSHGIMVVLFIRTWGMGNMVVHGEFDRMLLRPMGVFFQLTVNYINLIGMFDIIPGIIIFLYGCKSVHFKVNLLNVIAVIAVIASGVIIRAAFYIILGTLSFWTKRNNSLVDLGQMLLLYGTSYPITMYPYLIQVFLTFIMPIGFISFYPACEFLGKSGSFNFPISQSVIAILSGILFFVISQLLFKLGLRNYESAGS